MISDTVYIDTHIHGAFGEDVSDASFEGIMRMARRLPEFKVKAFCPTTMTIIEDNIMKCFEAVSKAKSILQEEGGDYAEILGIHLEGPFMSPSKAGVQNQDFCVPPSKAARIVERIEKNYPGLLKIIDVAPELDGGIEFIKEFSSSYVLSLAHTDADYDKAMEAFEAGASSVTHILNAMSPCSKRSPGVLGAAYDRKDIFCEVICDGIHIAPTVLRMLFELIDERRLIVISDSMRGAGMPDGVYKLADADVTVKSGRTYYGKNGSLAGSVTNMKQEADNLISYGIDPQKVHLACVENPLSRLKLVLK
ncbi:MAG: N-acetylglucosamine-6-phosphate deacetylase [Saccharofermentans sp.]|nr:N-acetylglucosamine-6-phosphate deacetylase [Saccharofermentans sp.]